MMYAVCRACSSWLSIIGHQHDVASFGVVPGYPDAIVCWSCGQPSVSLEPIAPLTGWAGTDVSVAQAITCLLGGGLPADHDVSATSVQLHVEGAKVKKIHTRPIRGSHRCAVDAIELDNEVKLYLAGSQNGAVVYRMVKPCTKT